MPAADRIFYGWWLVFFGMMGGVLSGLFLGVGFSAFFLPIQNELETSRAGLALAFSLAQLEAGITGRSAAISWAASARAA